MRSTPAYQPNLVALGHEVARRRKERGWTGEMLAGAAGVGARTIVNIEAAQKVPTLTTIYSVARALGVDLTDLMRTL